jgi:hypothetical protein
VLLAGARSPPWPAGVELGDADGLVTADVDGPADGDPVVCFLPPGVAVDVGVAVGLAHEVGVALPLALE